MASKTWKLVRTGPELSESDVATFEREIGRRLPDDYREFLLKANGGKCEPELGLSLGDDFHVVASFSSLLSDADRGMRRALDNLRELGVEGNLPFTSNMNQDDFCLPLKDGDETISMAVRKRKRFHVVGVDVVPVASSFTSFLDRLEIIPEVYCPVETLGQGAPSDLEIFLQEGNSIDAIGKNELSIVCEAIKFNNRPMIEACIERGASLDGAMQIAVQNRRTHVLQLLADAGANVNEKNKYGRPPLRYVGGTRLPDPEGAINRRLRDELLKLGAVE